MKDLFGLSLESERVTEVLRLGLEFGLLAWKPRVGTCRADSLISQLHQKQQKSLIRVDPQPVSSFVKRSVVMENWKIRGRGLTAAIRQVIGVPRDEHFPFPKNFRTVSYDSPRCDTFIRVERDNYLERPCRRACGLHRDAHASRAAFSSNRTLQSLIFQVESFGLDGGCLLDATLLLPLL